MTAAFSSFALFALPALFPLFFLALPFSALFPRTAASAVTCCKTRPHKNSGHKAPPRGADRREHFILFLSVSLYRRARCSAHRANIYFTGRSRCRTRRRLPLRSVCASVLSSRLSTADFRGPLRPVEFRHFPLGFPDSLVPRGGGASRRRGTSSFERDSDVSRVPLAIDKPVPARRSTRSRGGGGGVLYRDSRN